MRTLTLNDPAFISQGGTGIVSFLYAAGATQYWAVPNGVSRVTAKLWGGAGSGIGSSRGGYGGYVTGTIAVTGGQLIQVDVSLRGGAASNVAPNSGGGYSAIFYPSTLRSTMLVAGGGGGAGPAGTFGSSVIGGDAGPEGASGVRNGGFEGGAGGTTTQGGSAQSPATPGGSFSGGQGTSSDGAGGGAGYFGGGGAIGGATFGGPGGGGGANFVSGALPGLSINTSGIFGFSDPNWAYNAGSGAQGLVVLIYQ